MRGSCPRSCGGCQTESRSRFGLLRVMKPSKAPCAPRHALPRHWQNVGRFAWLACPCHFRCVPAQTRALVRHRLGEQRGWPRVHLINQPSTAPPDPKSMWQPLFQKSPRLPSTQDSQSPWRKPKRANHPHHASQFFGVPAF